MGEVVELAGSPEQALAEHWTKEQVDAAREAIVALVRPDQEISGYQAEAMAKAALLAAAKKAAPVDPRDYVAVAFGHYRIHKSRNHLLPGYVVTDENNSTRDPNPLNVIPGAPVFASEEAARRAIHALEVAKAIARGDREETSRLFHSLRALTA